MHNMLNSLHYIFNEKDIYFLCVCAKYIYSKTTGIIKTKIKLTFLLMSNQYLNNLRDKSQYERNNQI